MSTTLAPRLIDASIRTNAHPVILTGSRNAHHRQCCVLKHNVLLDTARDVHNGDTYGWAMMLWEATQWLRMVFDSPRIGGGIDPDVQLRGSLADAREENTVLGYIIGNRDECFDAWHKELSEAKLKNANPIQLDRIYLKDPNLSYMGVLDNLPEDRVQDMIVHAEAVAKRLVNQCELAGVAY